MSDPRADARRAIAEVVAAAFSVGEDPVVTAERVIDVLESRSFAVFASPGFVDFARAALIREDD